jgi:hypothetical protein
MSLTLGVSTVASNHFANNITTGAVTPNTSGSTFAVAVFGANVTSLTDTVGNTYSLRASLTFGSGTHPVYYYDCQNATGATNMTWTFTATTYTSLSMFVIEIASGNGSGTYPTIDGTVQTTSSANTTTGPPVSTSNPNEAVVSIFFGGGATPTITDSFNNILQSILASGVYTGALSGTIAAAAGSINDIYTVTPPGTSNGLLTVAYALPIPAFPIIRNSRQTHLIEYPTVF